MYFLNRALQAYAVGSVFKPVLAAAALFGSRPCAGVRLQRRGGGGRADLPAARAVCRTAVPRTLRLRIGKELQRLFYLGRAAGRTKLLKPPAAAGLREEPAAVRRDGRRGSFSPALREELAQSGQLANFSFGQGQSASDTHADCGTVQHHCSGRRCLPRAACWTVRWTKHPGKRWSLCQPPPGTGDSRSRAQRLQNACCAGGGRGHRAGCRHSPGGAAARLAPPRPGSSPRRDRALQPVVCGVLAGRKAPLHHCGAAGRRGAHTAYSGAAIFAQVCAALEAGGDKCGFRLQFCFVMLLYSCSFCVDFRI